MQPSSSAVEYTNFYESIQSEDELYPRETTPLIPRRSRGRLRTCTPFFLVLILLILILGIVISVYLLAEDDREWPINKFDLISRKEWGAKHSKLLETLDNPVSEVILTHSNTSSCNSFESCRSILLEMQVNCQNLNKSDIQFNFLVGGDGETYEGRGWDVAGEFKNDLDHKCISVAMMGNYSKASQIQEVQMREFNALLNESVRRKKLIRNYKIYEIFD